MKLVPVEKHGAETGGETVGDRDLIVAGPFGLEADGKPRSARSFALYSSSSACFGKRP
jgi:hypothetical protein